MSWQVTLFVPKANSDPLSFDSGMEQDVAHGNHSICKSVLKDQRPQKGMMIFMSLNHKNLSVAVMFYIFYMTC